MRLFIAIEIPKPVRDEIMKVENRMRQLCAGGRPVAEDNLHITLHFIGESDELVPAVEAMRSSVLGIRPFILKADKFGCFSRGSEYTSYVSVGGDLNELFALHESLQSALGDRGFRTEQKRYRPHITIGRNVRLDSAAKQELALLTPNASFTVNSIVLFESTRGGGRMNYTPLHKEGF